MKKTVLASAMALSIGSATSAQALTINITEMKFGGAAYAAEGTMNSDGTGAMQSIDNFFDNPWVADQQIWFENTSDTTASFMWSGTGTKDDPTDAYANFTYDFELASNEMAAGTFFDWNGNNNIPVLTIFDCFSFDIGVCKGQSLPMATAPFPGQQPKFNGALAAVPVPAAVWLMGSGLVGLISVARRKKA